MADCVVATTTKDLERRRARLLGACIAAGVLMVALMAAGPAGAQTGPSITPIVECSFLDPGTGLYNTVWGYQNAGTKDEVVPVGDQNQFDNPRSGAGQPTVFKKGRDQNVFIVTHRGPSTWRLTGQSATAPGAPCKSNPVPVVGEGTGSLVTVVLVSLALGVCAFVGLGVSRRRRPA